MLDKFSFMYIDKDIENFWMMKTYPLRVNVALQDGKLTIGEKTELFQQNLQREQEKFAKDIELYKEQVAEVKTLSSLPQALALYSKTEELQNNLDDAVVKKKEFNSREEILGQDITPYNDLDTLLNEFKPFYELTSIANDININLREWTSAQLMKQDTDMIKNSVQTW